VVDWLYGDDPLAAEFDGERLGIAGHSRGGVVVSEFGQRDPRVSAVVSWDRAQSTPLPTDLPLGGACTGSTSGSRRLGRQSGTQILVGSRSPSRPGPA
jgi:dienelactone hydrolase